MYLQDTATVSDATKRQGLPNGPLKQGLGWMYQILPYLEEGALKDIVRHQDLGKNPVSIFNCPSRRPITMFAIPPDGLIEVYLVDYAAAAAGPSRSEVESDLAGSTNFQDYLDNPGNHVNEAFYGCVNCSYTGLPGTAVVSSSVPPVQFRGIIQRTDWQPIAAPSPQAPGRHLRFTKKMTIAKIADGASKTLLVSEKWVHKNLYQGGGVADDRGWADGWDYDIMRSSIFAPRSDGDGDEPIPDDPEDWGSFHFGSAHPSGMNALFADGSVTRISYDIDREVFNRLGHRHDGEVVDEY
jgi:prepilin-type processing-associated H-X9-DG protein